MGVRAEQCRGPASRLFGAVKTTSCRYVEFALDMS
jgi:hypothetical protein